MTRVSIGWVAVNADGSAKRSHRSGYSWQTNLTSPPRVYTTEARAKAYANGAPVREAFVEL